MVLHHPDSRQRNENSQICRFLVLVACPLLLMIALQACESRYDPPPISAETLCGLNPEQLGTMKEEQLYQWIEEEIGCEPSRHEMRVGKDSVVLLNCDGEHVSGGFQSVNGHPANLGISIGESRLTFGEVVSGLGSPELVYRDIQRTDHNPALYSVGLEYPALGVSVYSIIVDDLRELVHEGVLSVTLSEDMGVDLINCYLPGSIEEVLWADPWSVYRGGIRLRLERSLPWPGFGAIVPLIDNR